MRKTLATIVLTLGLTLNTAPFAAAVTASPADPYAGVPEVCVPLLESERQNAVTNYNYLIGLIDAAEQQIWRRDDTIQYLRDANQNKKQKIRRLRAALAAERASN